MLDRTARYRLLGGAVAGVVLCGLVSAPVAAARPSLAGEGAGPVVGTATVSPSAVVLVAAGASGSTVAVDVADVDGVSGVVVRLVDPSGAVRRTVDAVLSGGSSSSGRWTIARQAFPVAAATGTWRAEVTACDTGAACTAATAATFTVRRNALLTERGAAPKRVVRGERTTLEGRLMVMSAAGRYVALYDRTLSVQFRASGATAWTQVRSVRTSGRGRVALPVKATRSGQWRLVFAGSGTYRGVQGGATHVDVSAVSTWVFGRSVRGRALKVTRIGDPSAPRRVLVVGTIHGNERAGLAVVSRLRRAAPPKGVAYFLVPNLNPDGAARNTRQNARGVDLNRNFPHRWKRTGSRWDTYYPGPRVASEPETRAAQRLIRTISPTLSIWYHQHMNLIDPAGGPRAAARAYGKATGMRVDQLVRYRGSASSWQGARSPNRPVFIVELPRRVSAAKSARHARAVRTVGVLPRG